jgi:glucokinase
MDLLCLLGDVGGTNVRLRLVRLDSIRAALPVAVASARFLTADLQAAGERAGRANDAVRQTFFPSLRDFISEFKERVKYCVLSVCGPVVDGSVVCLAPAMGDDGWRFNENMVAEALSMSATSVRLVNDFVAVGLSLPHLPRHQVRVLREPHGPPSLKESMACLGPGTGLGAVQLIWDENSSSYRGLASEAGMASFCPRTQFQWELATWIRANQVGDDHITVETIVSGAGIVNVYKYLVETRASKEYSGSVICHQIFESNRAEMIVNNIETDEICRQAFELFLEMLGEEAGDTAMRFRPAGGLYIAGGFLSRLIIASTNSRIEDRIIHGFVNKGKTRPCCDDIPLYIALPDGDDLAIFGLWQYAHSFIPASYLNKTCVAHVYADACRMDEFVADQIVAAIVEKPDLVLCLASGATPRGVYMLLGQRALAEPSIFSRVRVVQLDEWVGLGGSHPATTQHHLRKHFLGPCDVPETNYLQLRTDASINLDEECA